MDLYKNFKFIWNTKYDIKMVIKIPINKKTLV